MDIKNLKSGSDLRGTAIATQNTSVDLTVDAAKAAAKGFFCFLQDSVKSNLKIAVGCDARLSSPELMNAVMEQLSRCGVEVFDCGMTSTPSMFMATVYPDIKAHGAVMITASHHPFDKNGLKFFTAKGGVNSKELDTIISYALKKEPKEVDGGKVEKFDLITEYCGDLISKVRAATGEETPLDGFKIVVDAGNGVGGYYADRVLKPLGADVDGSQFINPDGNFPNHAPNPEDEEAMKSIAQCVLDNNADLGVIFDADGDRSAVVSKDGQEINRNSLIALISAIVLKQTPNATIVTDSITSDGLKQFIIDLGGVHHRFKRGYRNVIDEAIRLESEGVSAPLAIETSGHAALKENYFLDDGAYLVTKLLIEAASLKKEGKTLTSLIENLKKPLEQTEIRLSFTTERWKEYGKIVIDTLKNFALKKLDLAPDNHEGIRAFVPYAAGWFLVRMSVHDPIMPINIESDKVGGVKEIAKILYAFMSEFKGLNSSNLKIVAEDLS